MRRLLIPALCVALCGCGGPEAVEVDQLEQQVSTNLEESVGQAPDAVECVDPLPAEVGAEVRCTLAGGGDEFGLSVTVTEVEGDNVRFDIQVDEQPLG